MIDGLMEQGGEGGKEGVGNCSSSHLDSSKPLAFDKAVVTIYAYVFGFALRHTMVNVGSRGEGDEKRGDWGRL